MVIATLHLAYTRIILPSSSTDKQQKKAPEALYVFVDALTFGGSQFINSSGTGQYQDYILKELVSAVKKTIESRTLPTNGVFLVGPVGLWCSKDGKPIPANFFNSGRNCT